MQPEIAKMLLELDAEFLPLFLAVAFKRLTAMFLHLGFYAQGRVEIVVLLQESDADMSQEQHFATGIGLVFAG